MQVKVMKHFALTLQTTPHPNQLCIFPTYSISFASPPRNHMSNPKSTIIQIVIKWLLTQIIYCERESNEKCFFFFFSKWSEFYVD